MKVAPPYVRVSRVAKFRTAFARLEHQHSATQSSFTLGGEIWTVKSLRPVPAAKLVTKIKDKLKTNAAICLCVKSSMAFAFGKSGATFLNAN